MVNSSSQLPSQGRDSVVLSDLTRETLRVLLPATVAVAWCWLSGIVFLGGAHLANAYLVLLVVMVSALAVPSLYEQHLRLATGIYLASLTLAISIVAVYQKTSQGMYLYLLLIIAAGMLTRPVALGLVSLVAVSLGLAIGLAHLELRPAELTAPVLLMLLTGLTSWLGTRRLFTALDWAMTMTDQAQRNERE
ncbi:MAG: hypothetical protein FJZ90_04470, partial [Chloroflexi bacterium]|nr:hypothetical protein [Chloroflexota bacterium]